MTRLVRLRTQLLLAMGLPACWTQSTPSTTTTAPPIETPGVFIGKACRADTIPETICGSVDVEHKPGVTCGQRGDSLQSMPAMPIPRHGIGAAVLGDRIYVPGGATVQGFGVTPAHQVYTPPREKSCL